ncbi:hypothetical protein sync_2912 [Synechococcus sp. CC9311]|nr:hypothetical protein sync_2912 [Synechococcus sp. CC9311]
MLLLKKPVLICYLMHCHCQLNVQFSLLGSDVSGLGAGKARRDVEPSN